MSFLSGKKLLLVGFIIVLLVAIPLTVYLVGQQQKTKSSAEAATKLSLVQTPQTVKVGERITFDVFADPSNINQIGFIKLVLLYDPTKIATVPGSFAVAQWPSADGSTFTPSVPIGPEYTDGAITVSMSVGGSPQNVLQRSSKIATVTFVALDKTDSGVPTQVTFGNATQVLSLGGTTNTDEGAINMLSNSSPGQINITDGDTPVTTTVTTTVTSTLTGAATETSTPTDTPTPTDAGSANGATETSTPTDTPTPTTVVGLSCSSLTLDPGTSGTAPFAVNLTAVGNSTDSTISKVSFNFGDGQTQDVTDSGGVGTNSISVLTSHTYATSGNFNASATLTDVDGNTTTGSCKAVVAVTAQEGASPTVTIASPSPLPATGPTGLIAVGAIGVMLTFIGALLLFAL